MNPLPKKYRKSPRGWVLNTDYIPGYQKNRHLSSKDIWPSTKAMSWTMFVTEIYRIFNLSDLKEYLRRLGFVLHSTGQLDDYFSEGVLFKYRFKDGVYNFTVEDIFDNVGIQSKDDWMNFISGGWHSDDIKDYLLKGSIVTKLIGGLLPEGINREMLSRGDGLSKIDAEKNAQIFADDILAKVPSGVFDTLDHITIDKIKEIKAREHFYYNTVPIFHIRRLPEETRYSCMRYLSQQYNPHYFKNLKDFRAFAYAMIHLAWLFANEYMLPLNSGIFAIQECMSLDR